MVIGSSRDSSRRSTSKKTDTFRCGRSRRCGLRLLFGEDATGVASGDDPQYEDGNRHQRQPANALEADEERGDQQADTDGDGLGEALHEHVDERFGLVFFVAARGNVERLFGWLIERITEATVRGIEKAAEQVIQEEADEKPE